MDKQEKRLMKMSRHLVDIERALKRIEILVTRLYEERYSNPTHQAHPPPNSF